MSRKTENTTPEAVTQTPEGEPKDVKLAEDGNPGGNQRSVCAGERTSSGAKDAKIARTCVYCGPSVRGVARQYTVYAGTIPEPLKAFITAHPAARGLLVSVDRFAQVRKNLGRSGTAEAILFQKIKSEL